MTAVTPWALGHHGKFLVTAEGTLHHWRTDPAGVPHHAQAARALDVQSVIDGFISPTGEYWVTARDPTVDHGALMALAQRQASAAGLTRTAAE